MVRTKKKIIVAVAMSGGVDSSLAAALLLHQGYEVWGFTMDFKGGRGQWSCRPGALDDARRVAQTLGISHQVLPMRADMQEHVVSDFLTEYAAGRTPNPCVRCNQFIKFGTLLRTALDRGADVLASGHYARVVKSKGDFLLRRGLDKTKDQSYFLYRLAQEQLSRVLFPLGAFTKADVRKKARLFGLPVAEKPGSQDICFLAGADYRLFLKKHGSAKCVCPGPIVDTRGEVLGRHQGLAFYTVGQRSGLGVARGYPLYVIDMDPVTGRIVVGSRQECYRRNCELKDVHWITRAPKKRIVATVKIRYNHCGERAAIVAHGHRVTLVFARPQFAITPGQSAVFFSGSTVLGGGIIV